MGQWGCWYFGEWYRGCEGWGIVCLGGVLQQRLRERDVFVRRAWRSVDEEVVEWGPEDVGQELPDHGCLFGAPPYYGRGAGGEEEGQGSGVERSDCCRGGLVAGNGVVVRWRRWSGFRC